jgi:hypothetical protein
LPRLFVCCCGEAWTMLRGKDHSWCLLEAGTYFESEGCYAILPIELPTLRRIKLEQPVMQRNQGDGTQAQTRSSGSEAIGSTENLGAWPELFSGSISAE